MRPARRAGENIPAGSSHESSKAERHPFRDEDRGRSSDSWACGQTSSRLPTSCRFPSLDLRRALSANGLGSFPCTAAGQLRIRTGFPVRPSLCVEHPDRTQDMVFSAWRQRQVPNGVSSWQETLQLLKNSIYSARTSDSVCWGPEHRPGKYVWRFLVFVGLGARSSTG